MSTQPMRVLDVAAGHGIFGIVIAQRNPNAEIVAVDNFLHHFDRQTNVGFLKKTADALKRGGRVAVLEFVPNEDRVTPRMAAGFSLQMLAATPSGDAYTFPELRSMLAEAGFQSMTAHQLQGPQTVIIATK